MFNESTRALRLEIDPYFDPEQGGGYDPGEQVIVLGPLYKDQPFLTHAPTTLAHEIGHWKLDHPAGDLGCEEEVQNEVHAWRFALASLPPAEINPEDIRASIMGHLESRCWHPEWRPPLMRLIDDVVEYAKRQKLRAYPQVAQEREDAPGQRFSSLGYAVRL